MNSFSSWGRTFQYQHKLSVPSWRNQALNFVEKNYLPFGMGRSYGDSCLNDQGVLIHSKNLKNFISFDRHTGVLRCEAGLMLSEILAVTIPSGWFLPVTPGTKFVTIAGAVANDVHGKNHVNTGTFGCHVNCFELLRSDGNRPVCSRKDNPELFSATIGGLGLTGFITWIEIQLIPVVNAFIQSEDYQCNNLDEMITLFEDSSEDYQYTVAWIDCLASGAQLGRGIFTRGNHCTNQHLQKLHTPRKNKSIPFTFPPNCLNKLSVTAFNQLYFRKLGGTYKQSRIDYDRFFYPLDALHHWNRLYGPNGFIQYQCVLVDDALNGMKELLKIISHSGQPSPLNVLKDFGSVTSPGLLSFPRKGLTLALDFPFRGERTLRLCNELDQVVRQSKGALYPAKDSRMSAEMFKLSFPQLEKFKQYVDPKFSSSFWRRVQPN